LEKTGLAGDMDAVREVLTPEQVADFDNKIPVEVKAGEAAFHHPLMMHGSYENRSNRKRRATLINVFADGVASNRENDGANAPGADNYPRVPKGEQMSGKYYPLLLDPDETFCGFAESIPTINDV
jgi:ectoine hydroxylase-related dioxygenase (phytanoyl-CoA dioxygenase family)